MLQRISELLETQGANRHRVRAYRNAAESVRAASLPVAELASSDDREALEEIPGIGKHIATLIASYVRTGRSGYLDRLRGEVAPEAVIAQVPGIADTLARRIASALDVTTLEELEQAAHDGRLSEVEGFGPGRVDAVRIALAGMLSGAAQRRVRSGGPEEGDTEGPGVRTLLEVDDEYRARSEAGQLRKIAPKRFNPDGIAWLPIMHTDRDGWQFTALFSNTARAHELGTAHDWVVLYYERDGEEGQATVVTETRGALRHKRVVRGREEECRDYYKQLQGGFGATQAEA